MCYVFNKGTPFTARHFPLNTSFLLLLLSFLVFSYSYKNSDTIFATSRFILFITMLSKIASLRIVRTLPRAINRSIRAVVFPAFCTSFHSVSLSRFRAMQHPSTYQPHSFLRCFSLDGSASTYLQEEMDACTSFDAAVDLIPVFPVFFVISL